MTYYVPEGNWTQPLVNSFGELEVGQHIYPIDVFPLGDPAPGCQKDFIATYSCGSTLSKTYCMIFVVCIHSAF